MGGNETTGAVRTRMPKVTRAEILQAARTEFAEKGLSGARVDAIAERTQTSKRMIYYYFGSKNGLYMAVLEQAYGDMRVADAEVDVAGLGPIAALRRIVEATFDYQDGNPDFMRLVSVENVHRARHLGESATIARQNLPIIDRLREVIAAGLASGDFRRPIDPVDLHLIISSLSFFRMGNQHTFGTIFGIDLKAPETRARHRALFVETVLSLMRAAPDPACATESGRNIASPAPERGAARGAREEPRHEA